ncbi:MAG: potassium channel family protein [Candidatus Peribacteraceae bacterium]|nr:potassium channel family protein [Candidatus Peribacteraceae bacterium]
MAKKARIIFRLIDKLTQLQYATLLLLWIFLAVFFAAAYCILVTYAPQHGPAQLQSNATIGMVFLDSLYYSITTATTVGYGDIVPQGFSKALASLQSVTALLIWTIFVTKLVSHRQEEAIREVHRLTFEDVFHNVREGFFIIRKALP